MPKRKTPDEDLETTTNGNESPWRPSQTKRWKTDHLVDDLNALSTETFRERFIKPDALSYSTNHNGQPKDFYIEFKPAETLTDNERNECFKLVESTSRHNYEHSSLGWHPKRKKKEMREKELRYLLVRPSTPTNSKSDEDPEPVQAFLSFMLTHDSSPSMPVAYIYEIHLSPCLRRLGLGKHLMGIVEGVAERSGVAEKVMLSYFVANERAGEFYRGRGYQKDVCSPDDVVTRRKRVEADYVIMCKAVLGWKMPLNGELLERDEDEAGGGEGQGGWNEVEAGGEVVDGAGRYEVEVGAEEANVRENVDENEHGDQNGPP